MYTIPHQVSVISSGSSIRAFYDATPQDHLMVSSSSNSEGFSGRIGRLASKLLLLFVPKGSKEARSVDDDDGAGLGTPADILSTFFSFSFYLCFSPFKFKVNESGQYVIHKFIPQQILCSLISVTSIFIRIAEFRESWPMEPHESWNPVAYFRVSNAFCNLIFHIIIWLTFWIYSQRLLDILNFFQKRKLEFSLSETWTSKAPAISVLFCIINAIIGCACFLFGTDLFPLSSWDPKHLYECLLHYSKFSLFLHRESTCRREYNSLTSVEDMTPGEHVLTVTAGLGLYFRRLNGLYEELFILAGAFTFWLSANIFYQRLKDYNNSRVDARGSNNWASIYEKYLHLTELSDSINNAYGPVYFVFTITSLFYYSINLDNLLVSYDVLVRAKFMAFYTGLILTYLLSADICRQVGYFEFFISKHLEETSMSELSQKQLSLILHEIATNRVGMTGCHLFTITYSMVAQFSGVLITYFIISVQYR